MDAETLAQVAALRPCVEAINKNMPAIDRLAKGREAYGQHVVDFIGHDRPWDNLGAVAIQRFKLAECGVYFIGGDAGPIKIGSSNSPLERLATFQTGSPVVLRIHALAWGGLQKEREYHERFAAHRLHGEWFEPHEDILAEIARLTPQDKE